MNNKKDAGEVSLKISVILTRFFSKCMTQKMQLSLKIREYDIELFMALILNIFTILRNWHFLPFWETDIFYNLDILTFYTFYKWLVKWMKE